MTGRAAGAVKIETRGEDPRERFIDCVIGVRATLSFALHGEPITPDTLRLTELCAEYLMDAVRKYEQQTEGD
jgi:hypothetical protein